MSEEGGINRMVRKLFSKDDGGSTLPKDIPDRATKREGTGGLSRRTMLRGAAAVVAGPEKTGRALASAALGVPTVVDVVPTLSKEMVEKGAAQLMPYVQFQILLHKTDEVDSAEVRRLDEEDREDVGLLSEYLSKGNLSLPDKQSALKISNAFRKLVWVQNIYAPSLKLSDMQNPDIVAMAYKLAGIEGNERPGEDGLKPLALALQKVTSLPGSATIEETIASLKKKHVEYGEYILAHIHEFPNTVDQINVLRDLENSLDEESPEMEALYERLLEKEEELKPAYRAAIKESSDAREAESTHKFNTALESRTRIFCDVTPVYSANREKGKSHSFRFQVVGYDRGSAQGLNRVHIEHYRQSLYEKAGRAAEFVPAEPIVRESIEGDERAIVIETSDPLLIVMLQNALKKGGRVQIPNRQQAIRQREVT